MKTIFIAIFFLMTYLVSAQVVHDPKNNLELVQLGIFLKKIREQGQDVISTLKTAKAIQQYSKATEFAKTIEESYCIIQDLDFYRGLNINKSVGCFEDLNYQINLKGIENAIWQTMMSLESAVMTMGERQQAIQSAYDNLKESNKALNEDKEKLRREYDAREDTRRSLNKLATWF